MFDESNKVKINDHKRYDLVFIGDLVRVKRIDVLIDVISKVVKQIPDVKCVIVGKGPLQKEFEGQIANLNLSRNITMLGYVDNIYDILKQSKVFIMTSESEGLPIVLYEAISCGLPLIVPDVGDIVDLAENEVNALVVPALDVSAFKEACIKILDNHDVLSSLERGAHHKREQIESACSFDKVSDIWKRALDIHE